MLLFAESIALCAIFTVLVFVFSRDPIKTLYNYPPKIRERVSSLEEYKDKIPTRENKLSAKIFAALLMIAVISLILRYVNGYTSFSQGFGFGFLLWTIVNTYDVLVMDILWFCNDPYFVFKGTEDMTDEYHNYWFHIKESLVGEGIGLLVCAAVGLVIQFVL